MREFLTLRVPDGTRQVLRAEARRRNVPVARLVREGLARALEEAARASAANGGAYAER
jgi:hypothetical protein